MQPSQPALMSKSHKSSTKPGLCKPSTRYVGRCALLGSLDNPAVDGAQEKKRWVCRSERAGCNQVNLIFLSRCCKSTKSSIGKPWQAVGAARRAGDGARIGALGNLPVDGAQERKRQSVGWSAPTGLTRSSNISNVAKKLVGICTSSGSCCAAASRSSRPRHSDAAVVQLRLQRSRPLSLTSRTNSAYNTTSSTPSARTGWARRAPASCAASVIRCIARADRAVDAHHRWSRRVRERCKLSGPQGQSRSQLISSFQHFQPR